MILINQLIHIHDTKVLNGLASTRAITCEIEISYLHIIIHIDTRIAYKVILNHTTYNMDIITNYKTPTRLLQSQLLHNPIQGHMLLK